MFGVQPPLPRQEIYCCFPIPHGGLQIVWVEVAFIIIAMFFAVGNIFIGAVWTGVSSLIMNVVVAGTVRSLRIGILEGRPNHILLYIGVKLAQMIDHLTNLISTANWLSGTVYMLRQMEEEIEQQELQTSDKIPSHEHHIDSQMDEMKDGVKDVLGHHVAIMCLELLVLVLFSQAIFHTIRIVASCVSIAVANRCREYFVRPVDSRTEQGHGMENLTPNPTNTTPLTQPPMGETTNYNTNNHYQPFNA